MSAILTLPRLGETMESGRINAWLVEAGAPFRRGDALLEVETDKLLVEVPALEDGEIVEILAEAGITVSVGDALARSTLRYKGGDLALPYRSWNQEGTRNAAGATAGQSRRARHCYDHRDWSPKPYPAQRCPSTYSRNR